MGRRPRIEYAGATYHVIQRGNNREDIFRENTDKEYIIKDIFERKNNLGFRLLGYVIMSNHYHLLIQTMDENLHNIMHGINNRYSKYYNHRHHRTGHLYDGRYKALLVQDESYLFTLVRYIHQNPLKAGLCSSPEKYEWSSDYYYRNNLEGNINIGIVLDLLSPYRETAIKQYAVLVEENDSKDYENPSNYKSEVNNIALNAPKMITPRKKLDEILTETGVGIEDFRLIKEGSRYRYLTPYKKAYAKNAVDLNYSLKEIGLNISLSEGAIFKLIQNK